MSDTPPDNVISLAERRGRGPTRTAPQCEMPKEQVAAITQQVTHLQALSMAMADVLATGGFGGFTITVQSHGQVFDISVLAQGQVPPAPPPRGA